MSKHPKGIRLLVLCLFILVIVVSTSVDSSVRGIYIQQSTLENTTRINHILQQSMSVGINTFIIDLNRPTKAYAKNIQFINNKGIQYVARIVIFPRGGNASQVHSKKYWEKKYKLIKLAIDYGADEIQLDYIRYSTKRHASKQNAHDIYAVIKWYKQRLEKYRIPLQIAVFGETSFGESKRIGQHIPLFAPSVDVVCPMVYPSHYEPYKKHAKQPYKTVYDSLTALQGQFSQGLPFRLYPYIELSNYRYPLSVSQKHAYIRAQIKATIDAKADGWYAWSANNHYHHLFEVLKNKQAYEE